MRCVRADGEKSGLTHLGSVAGGGSCGAGEDYLLLIGGGHLLVEVVEGLIFVRGGKGEGAREGARDCDLAWVGFGLDEQECVMLPGNFAGLGYALGLKAGGQVVDDLIADFLGVLHVHWREAFVLIDKGMDATGCKEEAGDEDALRSGRARGSLGLYESHQLGVRIVEGGEVIDVGLDAFGNHGFNPFVELLFDFGLVVFKGFLAPVEGFLPTHDKTQGSVNGALIVESELTDAVNGVGGVGLLR